MQWQIPGSKGYLQLEIPANESLQATRRSLPTKITMATSPLFTCIIGPQSCGKTSVLFQHAISCAEQGQKVLFLTPSPLKQLPLLSSDYKESQPQPSTLERIHLKYPATLSGLQEFFDGIHESRSPQAGIGVPGHHGDSEAMRYTCIIVDEFHKYFASMLQLKSHEQLAAVARTCAHVIDAVSFLSSNQRGGLGAGAGGTNSCSCIVSIDEPTPVPGLKVDIVQRWFPNVFHITSAGDECSYVVSRWEGKGDHDRKQQQQQQQPMASYTIYQTHFHWHQKLKFH